MQRKGCKHLRIASILVILLGVISILAVQLLLGASEAETAAGLSESALKSLLTVILGGLLFIIQLAAEIVINIILLVIPYYYFHNAVRNYKDQ